MSEMLPWIGAQAEGIEGELPNLNSVCAGKREKKPLQSRALAPELPAAGFLAEGLASHQFPSRDAEKSEDEVSIEEQAGRVPEVESEEVCEREFQTEEERWEERRRARELERQLEIDRAERLRPYRGRTVKMLRRYLRTSIETGRLPSILGSAFFRSGVTCYSVVTFEDRVIFVHDMEICLEKLDEFSRQLIARCVLQEYSMEEAARLLQCDEKTIRRNLSMALDDCSEILLKMGLLEGLAPNREKSCQGGKSDEIPGIMHLTQDSTSSTISASGIPNVFRNLIRRCKCRDSAKDGTPEVVRLLWLSVNQVAWKRLQEKCWERFHQSFYILRWAS